MVVFVSLSSVTEHATRTADPHGRLVILDRDGVINQDSDNYIRSCDELIFIPGSLEAIARLHQAGYRIAIATNQSGVGRGYFDIDTLNQMHAKLHQALAEVGGAVDLIAFCPHTPEQGCDCRKPQPGLLQAIAERFNCQLEGVPVIGDALRDIVAAQRVAAKPMLVLTGKGEQTMLSGDPALEGVPVFANLAHAVNQLLASDL